MARRLFKIALVILVPLTISCVSVDPYIYFQEQLQAEVGESIDAVPPSSWRVRPDLVFKAPLPNGHIEYHYEFENIRGLCRFALEVDPATRKILGWRYDGEDKDKACFFVQ